MHSHYKEESFTCRCGISKPFLTKLDIGYANMWMWCMVLHAPSVQFKPHIINKSKWHTTITLLQTSITFVSSQQVWACLTTNLHISICSIETTKLVAKVFMWVWCLRNNENPRNYSRIYITWALLHWTYLLCQWNYTTYDVCPSSLFNIWKKWTVDRPSISDQNTSLVAHS